MTRPRTLLFASAIVLFLAGAWLSAGPARLTLVNAGLRVDYPWPRAVGAWVALLGLAAAILLSRRLWTRGPLACLAAITLYAALHLTAFRFDATDRGVFARHVLGTSQLAWAEVRKVETGPGVRVLLGPGEQRVEVDTTDLQPADAAALDRTIARRVTEAGAR